jgi:rod shape-determining protein MreD
MLRYLLYIVILYATLPFSGTVDLPAIIVFYVITNEDARFALLYALGTGLLTDLYYPARLGVNTAVYVALTQTLLFLKRFLVLNPLITIATFIVLYLVKTAVLNLIIASPIELTRVVYTVLAFFPVVCLLTWISHGIWMRK